MSEIKRIGEYLRVRRCPEEETGKTCVWDLLANDGSRLGRIGWYGPWRCYALVPTGQAVFNAACLRDVAEFCDRVRNQRVEGVGTR